MQTTRQTIDHRRSYRRANEIILGKDKQVRLALACLLAHGHLLIEDLPGVGKTTLAHTLARLPRSAVLAHPIYRSDMLPADVIGISIFDREKSTFRFLPWRPVFAGSARRRNQPRHTQDAARCSEAMRNARSPPKAKPARCRTLLRHRHTNPSSQIGTFPLPESQLDRFLPRIEPATRIKSRTRLAGKRRAP